MASEVFLIRHGVSLQAADPLSLEIIRGLCHEQIYRAKINRPRNGKHHRKLWALFQTVYEAQSMFPTCDHLRHAIQIAIGHSDTYRLDGKEVVVPRSISYTSMDQKGFEEFYERALAFILTVILPKTERQDLEHRLHEIIDGRSYHDDRR